MTIPEAAATSPAGRRTPAWAELAALRVMQFGALAVVLVASAHNSFDLDRFFVPKELALHAVALVAGLFSLMAIRRSAGGRVDRLLSLYLLLGVVAAALATNVWIGFRALAITASSIVVFWTARALRDAGFSRRLTDVLAFAVIAAAVTSLLQAYGVHIDVFSLNRAPGGTLGNRNFVAHAAAFGLPLCLLAALRTRARGHVAWGAGLVAASLVLTRSRAAWLATAAMLAVFIGAALASRVLRADGATWRRLARVLLISAGVAAAALLLPNALHWRSDNPYLDSMRSVTNYQEGSGRGRLVQYGRSLLMAARHPLLGVGPGNWPVVYPAHVPRSDPSLDEDNGGMTSNPWPSSDWIAFVSERGPAAAVVLALAFFTLSRSALRQLFAAAGADEALCAAALLGTIAAALVAGLFDAVLLLAMPSFLVWSAIGALSARGVAGPMPARTLALAGVLAITALGAARSGMQLAAMEIYATRGDRASLERASRLDPGSYRLHMRLARSGRRELRCPHARAAHALFPNADGGKQAAKGCGGEH